MPSSVPGSLLGAWTQGQILKCLRAETRRQTFTALGVDMFRVLNSVPGGWGFPTCDNWDRYGPMPMSLDARTDQPLATWVDELKNESTVATTVVLNSGAQGGFISFLMTLHYIALHWV